MDRAGAYGSTWAKNGPSNCDCLLTKNRVLLRSDITGSVDQELLLRNEYLVTENRILRHRLQGRLRLTESERISLAKIGKQLGRKALSEVAQLVRPETILGWHRRLVAKKFDGSKERGSVNSAPEAKAVHLGVENTD